MFNLFSIFSIPRGFIGHFDVIQRNAIKTWKTLSDDILLFGLNEPGAVEAAAELDVSLFSVARNSTGLPLINDAIYQARDLADNDILCMVNTDNILLSDLPPAIDFIQNQFDEFLMIGQRWNLRVTELLKFEEDWESEIRQLVREQNDPEHLSAVDYLIWYGNFWRGLPSLAVGQKGYDNLLVYLANRENIPTVDISRVVTVIHQDHPPTFRWGECEKNDELITNQYGPSVRGGITHTRYRLFEDHLLDRHTKEEIQWTH